jgi:hypothetical protein
MRARSSCAVDTNAIMCSSALHRAVMSDAASPAHDVIAGLPRSSGQTVAAAGWRAHRIRDILLAVLAFAAGSIDVLSWLALGKVFCAFMTGNAVFLAAGLFAHHSELSLHAALALCAFGVGAWATALMMPRQHPSVLWPARVTAGLIACAVVQLVFWVLWLAQYVDP